MIRLLDAATVGHIAAGEVIERPLSVVKELVENALDAGATRIAVAVRGGGLEAISVSDDGAGIAPDQLRLAFARHATSKITGPGDLDRIATLGFRGEGLASIAAVARVRAVSRTARDDVGYRVHAHELETSPVEPTAAPLGTRVDVEALFASVPARREFMRSPAAEFTRIANFLATLSLAYPHVAVALAHDGRPHFAFAASRERDERLAYVFGDAYARALVPLEAGGTRADEVGVSGFISSPGFDRPDRRMQLLFVNGRLLRTTQLAGAWSAGYATYARTQRQAYGVLFVDIVQTGVDPNVHPTKTDVRFRRADAVHAAVRRAIATTLANDAARRVRGALSLGPPAAEQRPFALGFAPAHDRATAAVPEIAPESLVALLDVQTPQVRVLAQLDDTYVLATDGRALVLVDQHAAHERVAYEAIAAGARSGEPVSEPLLVPFVVELDAQRAERFETSLDGLARAGLVAEAFGERTYRIVATPAGYGARRFDLAAYVADLDDEIAGSTASERVWASLACHSVVRAGDPLERGEMEALLVRLMRCENPMHCPHGRPTIVRLEPQAMARLFKRT